ATGKELRSFSAEQNTVGDKLAFSPGGQFLVCRVYKTPEIHFYPVEVLANDGKYQDALAASKSSAGIVDKIKDWANVETRGGQLQVFPKENVTDAQLADLKQLPQTGLLVL